MTGFEIKMDGVKYFVTAQHATATSSSWPTLVVDLYLDSLRSTSIYQEIIQDETETCFGTKKAKSFIKRALAYDPKEK